MFGHSDCSIRDHFEAAVVLHYRVKLTLKNSLNICGVAINLRADENKNECLEVLTSRGIELVEIDQIRLAEVTTENARFRNIPINKP